MRAKLIFAKLLDSLLFSFSVFLFAVEDIRIAIGKHLIIYDVCEAGKVCVCVCKCVQEGYTSKYIMFNLYIKSAFRCILQYRYICKHTI